MPPSILRPGLAAIGFFAMVVGSPLVGCDDSPSSTGGAAPDGGVVPPGATPGTPGAPPATPGTPAAGDQTFGPDLTTLPGTTNTFGCADGYPIQTNPTFPQPFYAAGAQSCLVLTFAVDPQGRTLQTGTVVSATIRVDGTVTGQMRFVRMRILYSGRSGAQCCSLEQYGDPFTPAAGQQTTVQLGFHMDEDHVPPANDLDTIVKNDILALEVLAPNVPIPGYWPANGGPVTGTSSFIWLPALSAQNVQAPSATLLNYTGSYSGFLPAFSFVMRND